MLLQVDSATFFFNLSLIIGAVIFLVITFFFLIATITGIKVLVFWAQQRSAEREHIRETRQPDGKLYPPFIEGVCSVCRKGDHKIYFPSKSEGFCPACYMQRYFPDSISESHTSVAD